VSVSARFDTVPALTQGLSNYFDFYRYERSHQALGYCTPADLHGRRAKSR
jgi:transposase InsO family protein